MLAVQRTNAGGDRKRASTVRIPMRGEAFDLAQRQTKTQTPPAGSMCWRPGIRSRPADGVAFIGPVLMSECWPAPPTRVSKGIHAADRGHHYFRAAALRRAQRGRWPSLSRRFLQGWFCLECPARRRWLISPLKRHPFGPRLLLGCCGPFGFPARRPRSSQPHRR